MRLSIFHVFFLLLWCTIGVLYCRVEVLFSPDDHPTNRLMQLIDAAHTKIHAAIYMLTDKNIAQALINAKKRGVDVQIIVDPTSVESSCGKGPMLKQNNIDLFVFNSKTKSSGKVGWHGPIMHNKFALIDNQLWTGSFNWTKSANIQNQENVVVTDDQEIYKRFEKHFHVMKDRCTYYGIAKPPDTAPTNDVGRAKRSDSWWDYYVMPITDAVVSFVEYIKHDVEKVMHRI